MERREVGVREQLSSLEGLSDDQQNVQLMRLAESLGEKLKEHISPPGQCKAQVVKDFPKLEEYRLKYGIPDAAFTTMEATFDRILVFQAPRVLGNKIEGSKLYMPDSARRREEESVPRGIIISAGLKARDNLVSNGIDIGHMVNFIRLSPFRIPYMSISGQEFYLLVMRDGDIIASEELPAEREGGLRTLVGKNNEGGLMHYLEGSGQPKVPFISEDY
jgi:hypothetical protein